MGSFRIKKLIHHHSQPGAVKLLANQYSRPNFIHYEVVNLDHPFSPLSLQFKFITEKHVLGDPGSKPGEFVLIKDGSTNKMLVSLGLQQKAVSDTFRKAGGSVGAWLVENQVSSVDLSVDDIDQAGISGALQALLEGIILGSYQFNLHKKQENETSPVTIYLRVAEDAQFIQTIARQVHIITDSVLLAREWSQEPANVINPPVLAERAAFSRGRIRIKMHDPGRVKIS